MQPPQFWHRPPGVLSGLLTPISWLAAAITARRVRQGPDFKADVPVICVGNINIGGTGKTPTTMALAQLLTQAGHRPHVVSRGYGGALTGPVQVNAAAHSASEVGDEPLLLSQFAPTWVAKNRAAGAQAAQAAGADVLLLDDGFQNPSISKDLNIVVVDAARGFGNGKVLPAGPLREPVTAGLARADLVLSIGPQAAQDRFATQWADALDGIPHLTARLEPLATGMPWEGQKLIAFAGIGHPERFFATLRGLGAQVLSTVPLEDHQPISDTLLTRLRSEAKASGARLITTEKDMMRLPNSARSDVSMLPVRLVFPDDGALKAALSGLKLG